MPDPLFLLQSIFIGRETPQTADDPVHPKMPSRLDPLLLKWPIRVSTEIGSIIRVIVILQARSKLLRESYTCQCALAAQFTKFKLS